MAVGYVLYNPQAGNCKGEEDVRILEAVMLEPLRFFDMTRITNYKAFLGGLEQDDYLVIAGGDGTLNRFANAVSDLDIRQEILFFPAGTGNDFARDLGKEAFDVPFSITQYLRNLPAVEVKGKTYRFINGVGYGIDGYCCQVGDELRKIPGKKVNYAAIAVKGLLFHYSATNAVVTVDGKMQTFRNVWIAPTMHGRFYGGGMIPAPEQDRCREDGKLSLMIFHGAGKLKTLCIFPGIFKGTHVKHTKQVTVLTGHEITVEFDRPVPLQIDGETILDVVDYRARSGRCVREKKPGRSMVV